MVKYPFHIGFCAPSRTIDDDSKYEAIERYLIDRGAKVTFDETVFHPVKQFGGTENDRLAAFMRQIEDPTVDVVMPVRGGYGLSRLLDAIDYEAIARHNPICCGFSDFTAFNLAYLAHTGKVSYQGPTGVSLAASVPDLTETSFLNAVIDTVWQVHFETTSDETLNLEGCLWGGNLSMMVSLLGTPHFPKIKGGLLYLEDVHERAYRVERMLLQLDMAGVLRQQKAIILGDFQGVDGRTPLREEQFAWRDVVEYLRKRLPEIPIIEGLPFGHIPERVTMPVGAMTRLTLESHRVTLTSTDHPTIQK